MYTWRYKPFSSRTPTLSSSLSIISSPKTSVFARRAFWTDGLCSPPQSPPHPLVVSIAGGEFSTTAFCSWWSGLKAASGSKGKVSRLSGPRPPVGSHDLEIQWVNPQQHFGSWDVLGFSYNMEGMSEESLYPYGFWNLERAPVDKGVRSRWITKLLRVKDLCHVDLFAI